MVEGLQRDYPAAFTAEILPIPKQWLWYGLGTGLRTTLDYWRYLRPEYRDAVSLRERAREQAPAAATWFRSVLIDRGRNHGVHSGMPLISEEGLVGLLTATSRNAAKGMLLLDRQSAVSALVQRSRDRGVC